MTESYSDMISLLRQASYSSEAVDYFDLRSDDQAMMAAWNWLLKEQRDSMLALVKHVQASADEIIAVLNAEPIDAPSEPPPALLNASDLSDYVYTALTHYAIRAEHATRDPTLTIPDATSLPEPGRWKRRDNSL